MSKKKTSIGFMETQFSGVTKALTSREAFMELANRPVVTDVCLNRIPEAKKQGEDLRKLKGELPLIIFMAHCEDGGEQPVVETAISTGLCIHDFDHTQIADIRSWYTLNVEPFEESLGVLYAGISPSGEGLRLVTKLNPGESITKCQTRVANTLHLERDKKVCNISRGSYAVPCEYMIKVDDQLFSLPEIELEDKVVTPAEEPFVAQEDSTEVTATDEMLSYLDGVMYENIPMKEIIHRLMEQMCGDGVTKEGNRETTAFKMAVQLRPLTNCDFRYTYELLAPLFKQVGLDDEEIRHAVSNGISQRGGYTRNMSPMMQSICRSVRADLGVKKEPLVLPPYDLLPPVVCDILNCYPQRQHMAVLMALMAMLGTLGTGVRFCDENRTHSLAFFVAVTSQFGGGKGFINNLEQKVLSKLLIHKKEMTDKAEAERKERLETTNMQVRQKRNVYASPILADNITSAQLIDALNELKGKHGFLCTEEISSLIGSLRSEHGSQIGYVIKKGFDNGIVSKETKTDQSANVFFHCYLNLVLCGTPAMMMRFFNSAAIEDGTASRFMIVDLDPGLDGFSPKYKSLSKAQQNRLDKALDFISAIGEGKEHTLPSGEVETGVEYFPCDYLLRMMNEYMGEQVELYKESGESIFRQLANRAAVYGLRAGMMMWLLWGCPRGMKVREGQTPTNEKMLKVGEFAKWIAEYTQMQQYKYFAKQIEIINDTSYQMVSMQIRPMRNIDICSRFHGTFSSTDFKKLKYTLTKMEDKNPSQTLNRLVESNPSRLKRNESGWEYIHNAG